MGRGEYLYHQHRNMADLPAEDDLLYGSDEGEAELVRPEEYRDNTRADHEDEDPVNVQGSGSSLSGDEDMGDPNEEISSGSPLRQSQGTRSTRGTQARG